MISSDQLSASRPTRLSLPQYIELDGTGLQLHGELVDLDVQRHRNIEDATGAPVARRFKSRQMPWPASSTRPFLAVVCSSPQFLAGTVAPDPESAR